MERATNFIEVCGQFIRARREELRLTQSQLATRCGMTWKHLGKIELGAANPRLSTLIAIARGLEIDLGEMIAQIEASSSEALGQRHL